MPSLGRYVYKLQVFKSVCLHAVQNGNVLGFSQLSLQNRLIGAVKVTYCCFSLGASQNLEPPTNTKWPFLLKWLVQETLKSCRALIEVVQC